MWGLSPNLAIIFQVDARTGQLLGSNFFGPGMSDIAADRSRVWESDVTGSITPYTSLALRSPLFHDFHTDVIHDSVAVPGADAIAVGREDIWVLDEAKSRIFPVDRSTHDVGAAIQVPVGAMDVVAGGQFVWVANASSISWISQTTHLVTTTSLPGLVSGIATTDMRGGGHGRV